MHGFRFGVPLLAVVCAVSGAAFAQGSLAVERAEGNTQVLSLASEALRTQLGEDFGGVPTPLRDSMLYGFSAQPQEAWSPELRTFAQRKFEAAARTDVRVAHWLASPEAWKGTKLQFGLICMVDVWDKGADAGVAFTLPSGAPGKVESLGKLMGSLTPEQRAVLFAGKMRLPVAQLTGEQKKLLVSTLGLSLGESQVKEMVQSPTARVSFDFQFKAVAYRTVDGTEQRFETMVARPFDYNLR